MSLIWKSDDGFLVSHNKFILQAYNEKHQLHPMLFDIRCPYKVTKDMKTKNCVVLDPLTIRIKNKFEKIMLSIKKEKIFLEIIEDQNVLLKSFAEECVKRTLCLKNMKDYCGGNSSHEAVYPRLLNCDMIIPKFSRFICGDVRTALSKLQDDLFDFIILDPPWWNKYIRRKKSKDPDDSYKMLYNTEIEQLPIGKYLLPDGVVAVWCTNCINHEEDVKTKMFPAWNLTHIATWYWMKVTKAGEPICNFGKSNAKQPYERIIIGAKDVSMLKAEPIDETILISIPSILHSHKPPLNELLRNFTNKSEPKYLEIFARYLLPHTTSIGFEPLRWQHMFMYTKEINET